MNILIFGYGNNSTPAVSNIMFNLSKELSTKGDFNIVLFGYGQKDEVTKVSDSVEIVSIKDPFQKSVCSKYRMIRKFDSLFKIDDPCLSWKYLFKNAKRIFNDKKIDFVIGVAGKFMYTQAAYHFAKSKNLKLGLMYFDPFVFVNNNKQNRKKIEKEWYEYASFIKQNAETTMVDIQDTKGTVSKFFIPIFEKPFSYVQKGPIMYGGAFYKGFRGPNTLLDFIKNPGCKNESFCIYSNEKNCFDNLENVSSFDLIKVEDFSLKCLDSKALIVIGNGSNQAYFPSKILDVISYRKPIIGLNFKSSNSPLFKYPFYYPGEDIDVFEKINNLSEQELKNFDIYTTFPERDPNILINSLINEFQK